MEGGPGPLPLLLGGRGWGEEGTCPWAGRSPPSGRGWEARQAHSGCQAKRRKKKKKKRTHTQIQTHDEDLELEFPPL